MKKILILLGIIICLNITFVSAQLPNNTFQPGDIVNVNVFCTLLNNSICNNNSASCFITAFNPDTTFLVQNETMQGNSSGFYNYSFGVLDEGTYSALVYCRDSEEGVISFDFTVGILETIYDNLFWLYIFLYLIPTVLIIISKIVDDRWFACFAGIILVCFGIYLAINGLPYFDNKLIEMAQWTITLAIGLYFLLDNAIKIVEEEKL